MEISSQARGEIEWWLRNLEVERQVRISAPESDMYTDASLEGWGACRDTVEIGGRW